MRTFYLVSGVFLVMLLSSLMPLTITGQTLMPLPAHSSVYSNIYARGLWFVAPVNFTITGLKVAPEAGSGLQYIHVMKCTDTFPIGASAPGSALFTTLSYISGAPNNVVQTVNIPVQQGDQIGILGTVTGINNSYAATAIVTSTIGGQSVFLNRFGYQGSIETGPAPGYWGFGNGTSGQIGRIYVYYSLGEKTDAGIDSLIFPGDSICSGPGVAEVLIKNHGPQPLVNVQIQWKVNNNVQPTYSWSGNLAVNAIDTVQLGTYTFDHDTVYSFTAFTSTPNYLADTATSNDTVIINGIYVKESPVATPLTTNFTVCPGDTLLIGGTLSGQPPWSLKMENGSNTYYLNNLSVPSFAFAVVPEMNTTYTITEVTDGGFCTNFTPIDIVVTTKPAPSASIALFGSTTFCQGDSVMMVVNASGGTIYQWLMSGSLLPGDTGSFILAKQSGMYAVRVTGSNGCSTISTPVNVTVHPLPFVFLGNDTVLLPSASIPLNAGAGFASYQWSTGATTQQITLDTNGIGIGVKIIWVKVTDANGCKTTDTIRVHFTPNPGIREASNPMGLSITPNPTKGMINISLENTLPEQLEISIFSLDGKRAYHSLIETKGVPYSMQLDLGQLTEGMYFISFTGQEKTVVRKLIISR